jgi:hypothetical protein
VVGTYFLLFRLVSGFTDVPSLRQSVAVLSPWRPGLYSSPDYAEFMVDKTTMGQVFSEYFGFHLSLLFHKCYIYIFVSTPFLS